MGKRHKKNRPYMVAVEYIGFDRDLDNRICKKARVPCGGSGAGFGLRDMDFFFAKRNSAIAAAKRIRALRTHSRNGNFIMARVVKNEEV